MPKPLTLMVASTVYNFEDQIRQICAVLNGYGYEVWNSHLGTIPVHPRYSNQKNCVAAAGDCDAFLGIIRPVYGSSKVGKMSITHEEIREAVKCKKPRWFLVHHDVAIARQLLKPYFYKNNGRRTKLKFKQTAVLDDLRVIDIYNDAIQIAAPYGQREGNWAQEFFRLEEALLHIDAQFRNEKRVRRICKDMQKP